MMVMMMMMMMMMMIQKVKSLTSKQYNNRFCLRNSFLVSALKNLISRGDFDQVIHFFLGGGGRGAGGGQFKSHWDSLQREFTVYKNTALK